MQQRPEPDAELLPHSLTSLYGLIHFTFNLPGFIPLTQHFPIQYRSPIMMDADCTARSLNQGGLQW